MANPSQEYMRERREDEQSKLGDMQTYDRGYKDGKASMEPAIKSLQGKVRSLEDELRDMTEAHDGLLGDMDSITAFEGTVSREYRELRDAMGRAKCEFDNLAQKLNNTLREASNENYYRDLYELGLRDIDNLKRKCDAYVALLRDAASDYVNVCDERDEAVGFAKRIESTVHDMGVLDVFGVLYAPMSTIAHGHKPSDGMRPLPKDLDGNPIDVGDYIDFMGASRVDAIGNENLYVFADNWHEGVYDLVSSKFRKVSKDNVEVLVKSIIDDYSSGYITMGEAVVGITEVVNG